MTHLPRACHKRTAWLLPGLLLMAGAVKAQLGASNLTGPGVAINVDYLPASHYIRPEDSLKMPATTSQQRISLGAAFLLSSHVDTITGKVRTWSLGAFGTYSKFTNKDYEKQIFPDELLGTQISLLHKRTINSKWSLMAMVSAGVFTDMEKIDYEDVVINGGVIFIKRYNPRFSLGIGAVLTNSFGAPMVLPAFLLSWKTNGRFKVEVNIPEKISVSSTLNKYDDLALALRLSGAAFDVEKHPDNKRQLGYSEITVGLENTFHLTRKVDFNIAGGSVLVSSVQFREKKLSSIFSDVPSHRLATNFYLSAGVRWNFR
ncbi:DUF6268 family outer membrane beta-barrel protein [Chitinophaga flava]|nr:DUF6268 family outer membrane beta-barrel protein [Chitinophaga flava]